MNYKERYDQWVNSEITDAETKNLLLNMSDAEIEDSFSRELEFGTGGLRGVMGLGSNRMNIYTVRLATQGLAEEIKCLGAKYSTAGVVIAYDSRNNSPEFAHECARVLCANGIKTYLFPSLRPTPELSFAVRYLKCIRGIVITASHNPKEYNGYKVYGEDGGQIPPAAAENITRHIKRLDIFKDVKVCEDLNTVILDDSVDRAYLDAVKEQSFSVKIPDDFSVVYTPLHGTGNIPVRKILAEIGVNNLFIVSKQENPDGNFSTVKSPNPENHEAFTLALEYAKTVDADIVLGTDPDCDRIGVAAKDKKGNYILLNGNQTGSLLCEYILRKSKQAGVLPQDGRVIKTIVTTDLVSDIAADYGVTVKNVLTGFKFIGEQIKLYENEGRPERFIFGLEESYGYLKGTYARDKDAVVAAMLICEMAADYKSRGMTLYDGLKELYKKYGYYREGLRDFTLKGISGTEKINKIMDDLRRDKFNFPDCALPVKKLDYTNSIDGLPKSNVLKFVFKNGWLAVRPSGTEPKIKLYYSVKSTDPDTGRTVGKSLEEFIEKIMV